MSKAVKIIRNKLSILRAKIRKGQQIRFQRRWERFEHSVWSDGRGDPQKIVRWRAQVNILRTLIKELEND